VPSKHVVAGSNPAGEAKLASVVELVYTQDLKSCAIWIEGSSPSTRTKTGTIAQWLEQSAHNALVVGSNPTGPTKIPEVDRNIKDRPHPSFADPSGNFF
jgi:hypothetical protein